MTGESVIRYLMEKDAAGRGHQIPEPAAADYEGSDTPDALHMTDAEMEAALRRTGLNWRQNNYLDVFYAYTLSIPLLTPVQEVSIGRRIHAQEPGWEDALRQGVEANYRLAFWCASKFAGGLTHLQMGDLVQEGVIGLYTAWKGYNPDHRKEGEENRTSPYRFTTYATPWVKQAIRRAIENAERTIRLPTHAINLKSRINLLKGQLEQSTGMAPTLEQIAEMTRTDKEILSAIMAPDSFSLERYLTKMQELVEQLQLDEIVPDTQPTPEEQAIDTIYGETIVAGLDDALAERLSFVIKQRFGFNETGEVQSLEKIGRQRGVTRERVRQLERKALNQLRNNSEFMKKL